MGLLRFLLAISVVAAHAKAPIVGLSFIPADMAVEVFFVISGFYMALILKEKYQSIGTFYLNRLLRLYPTFIVVTLAVWGWFLFARIYLGKPPATAWGDIYHSMSWMQATLVGMSNWTMVGLDLPSLFHFDSSKGFMLFHAGGFTDDTPDGAQWAGKLRTIGPAWSIGMEIWFYLAAPFLICLRTGWLVAIAVASLVIKLAMTAHGLNAYFFFPAQLWLFILGILLLRLYYAAPVDLLNRKIGWFVLALCLIVFVAFTWAAAPLQWGMFWLLVLAVPLIFALTKDSGVDAWIGSLSYPIYLVHVLIIGILFNVLHRHDANLAALTSIAAAIMICVAIEQPIDKVRQRIARNAALTPASPAPVERTAAIL